MFVGTLNKSVAAARSHYGTSLLLVCGFAQQPTSEWFERVRAAQGHSSITCSSAKNDLHMVLPCPTRLYLLTPTLLRNCEADTNY